MNQFLKFSLLVFLLLAGCNAPPTPVVVVATATSAPPTELSSPMPPTALPSTMAETHDVLVKFLTYLHERNYADAVPMYGGEYESLQAFNPQIDPADKVALWAWACDNQLLQCLEVRSATFTNLSGDSYIFQVEFSNPDGSLFVRSPCCGANETEMPPVSQFEYTVSRNADHRYVVMNPPPYVP